MPEKPVGKVEHYYPKVKAAAVRLTKPVKLGDKVHIVGHGDDFKEEVTSLQMDHQPIQEGKPGESVGLYVEERVHKGDDVLLIEPDAAKPAKPKAAKKAPAKKARTAKAKPKKAARKPKAPKKAKKAKAAKKGRKKAGKKAKAKTGKKGKPKKR